MFKSLSMDMLYANVSWSMSIRSNRKDKYSDFGNQEIGVRNLPLKVGSAKIFHWHIT